MTENESQISIHYLRECFETSVAGRLTWNCRPRHHFPNDGLRNKWNGRYAGTPAGSPRNGYRGVGVTIGERRFQMPEHRIIWALAYGAWPKGNIDHINAVRSDNRIENLRDVTQSVNMQNQWRASSANKSSGLLGVTLHKKGKWQASIQLNGKARYLGLYVTPEAAHHAYLTAKRELHPGGTP